MCETAAEGLRIQRGRQFGFFGEQFNERATIVSEMSDDDLTLIPSHNFDCERDLAILGIHIENTKCSNRHFKVRCTGDNAMLQKSSQVKRIKGDIKEVLDEREQEWYDQQKKLKPISTNPQKGQTHSHNLLVKVEELFECV